MNKKDDDRVIESCIATVQEIFDIQKYCDLDLRVSHQTAAWRLILFDEIALVSSYRTVKKLPIFVFKKNDNGFYGGFKYCFDKIFELSEQMTNLEEYKEMIERNRAIINRGQGDLMIKLNNRVKGI